MNDLSADIGLLKRQVRDVQSVAGNIQNHLRKLDQPQRARPSPQHLFARAMCCYVLGMRQTRAPAAIAGEVFGNDAALLNGLARPGAIGKSVTNPANTTTAAWAGELVGTGIADLDLLQLLSPQSVYAQLSTRPMTIRVNLSGRGAMKIPSRAPSPTFSPPFLAEGAPIAVRQLALGSTTITPKKAAVISVFTEEMLNRSTPNIEKLIRITMTYDASVSVDSVLLGSAAGDAVSPPGLLAGVAPTAATAGGGLAAFAGDVRALAVAIEATGPLIDPVLIMSSTSALLISVLALGGAADMPIIAASTVPAKRLIMLDAASFGSGEGDQPDISTTNEAMLHEETAPTALSAVGSPNTVAAPTRSMFQTQCIALRLIQDATWAMTRTGRVAYVDTVTW